MRNYSCLGIVQLELDKQSGWDEKDPVIFLLSEMGRASRPDIGCLDVYSIQQCLSLLRSVSVLKVNSWSDSQNTACRCLSTDNSVEGVYLGR